MFAKDSKKRPQCTTLRDESEDTGKEATKFLRYIMIPPYSMLFLRIENIMLVLAFLRIELHVRACFLAD